MTGRWFKAAKLFGVMMGATVLVCAATELLTYVVVGHRAPDIWHTTIRGMSVTVLVICTPVWLVLAWNWSMPRGTVNSSAHDGQTGTNSETNSERER